ncbi:Zinc finger (C3HC4-type RING finger) family protein [Zea mays]|uniref:Zinc finger (C3HC4-type RING finger) family protein n=2 Tax=Zea mays TaxID=4577 RepID=A0A1D6LKL0_MAIZE|nr:Zinc finger (C3HC4-type RING finger) family protein [Zea mays]
MAPILTMNHLRIHVPQATAAAETVRVITTPVFPHIPRLQASKDFQVLVRIEAPPAAQPHRRVPVDIAVVLDVGGSTGTGTGTGTGTTRLDAVKKAVKFIIRQIHDDDRLAVVGPSNYRLVTGFLNTHDARRNVEKSVDQLEPRGEFTSGSGAGLEEAIKILERLPTSASRSSRARFVILVTDTAVAESGSRFISKLPRDFMLPVHTFGLGAAHDPRALFYIASESHGTYSFVDDQNTDGITGAIAVCLSGLKDVVAVGTRVRVEAPVGSGVTIEGIQSGGYSRTRDDKTYGEVALGVLYAGEVKSFIVHLSVPALSSTSAVVAGGCDEQQLLTASFVGHYTASAAAPDPPSPMVTQAILYVQRPPPEAFDVASGGALQRVPVPVVLNHIARFDVLEMVATFVDTDIIWRLSSIVTSEVATKLRIQWDKFLQARQFWSGLDLGVLNAEVRKMVSILEAAGSSGSSTSQSTATAYMLSWLSSYQMQRPTAMGSPGSVASAFVTVNMQLTLQQTTIVPTAAPLCICHEISNFYILELVVSLACLFVFVLVVASG